MAEPSEVKHQDEKYPTNYASGKMTDVKQVRGMVERMVAESNPENLPLSEETLDKIISPYLAQMGATVSQAASLKDRKVSSPCNGYALDEIIGEMSQVSRCRGFSIHQNVKVHKLRPVVGPRPTPSVPTHRIQLPPVRKLEQNERCETILKTPQSRRLNREGAIEKKDRACFSVALNNRRQDFELKTRISERQIIEQGLMAKALRAKASWNADGMKKMRAKVRIIIVGAGLAGLSTAEELLRLGFTGVKLLEASNRVGGRLHAVQLSDDIGEVRDSKCYAELGCSAWVSSDPTHSVYNLAKEHGLLHTFQQHRRPQCQILTPDGRQLDASFVATALRFCSHLERDVLFLKDEILPQGRDHASVAFSDYTRVKLRHLLAGVREEEKDDLSLAVDSIETVWKFATGDSSGDMAADFFGPQARLQSNSEMQRLSWQAVGSTNHDVEIPSVTLIPSVVLSGKGSLLAPGDTRHFPKYPMTNTSHLCSTLMRQFFPGLIKYEARVRCVDWSLFCSRTLREGNRPETKVHCENKKVYRADHVIMAVPLGHLKKFAGQMFQPSLSTNKLASINRMGVGTVSKIFLCYEKPPFRAPIQLIWSGRKPGDVKYDSASLSSRCLRIITTTCSLNILEVTLLGDTPALALDDAHVVSEVSTILDLFQSKPGSKLKSEVSPPSKIIRSNWGQDPLFMGSHPYFRRGCTGQDAKSLGNPVTFRDRPVIQFAGDYTGPDLGRLTHAARVSGLREAKRLSNFYDDYFGWDNINPSFAAKSRVM
ncbi:spermine oxidase [Plakobranchus ocellatus]|uniref:Spermine oxidase n=1 Tax=Plakobranchus ocellatus TaxID=259542 RepID=A0AAV3Z436_9GAST|nr:spermine oxidase [Plakobranchus ocellatus]